MKNQVIGISLWEVLISLTILSGAILGFFSLELVATQSIHNLHKQLLNSIQNTNTLGHSNEIN